MEGITPTEIQYRKYFATTEYENIFEENFQIENDLSSDPNESKATIGPKLSKKTISFILIVTLTLLTTCLLIVWNVKGQERNNQDTHNSKEESLKSQMYSVQTKMDKGSFHNSTGELNASFAVGIGTRNDHSDTTKKEILLKFLKDISDSKTISGIFVDDSGTDSRKGANVIYKITEVHPGMICTQMPSSSAGSAKWSHFINEIISNWNDGYLVRIDWGYDGNPLRIMTNFTETSDSVETEKRWNDLIEDGTPINKLWKTQLDLIVPYLKQLEIAGVVTIMDIIPIINQKRYIWRGRPGVNGTSKLYKMTYDYLTKRHNLTSFIWTWSLSSLSMTQFEDFWPGDEYVDVASIDMEHHKELPFGEYQRLINIVGDKPISLEWMYSVPTRAYLAAQPRWTWFTVDDDDLEKERWNEEKNTKETFNSYSVINKENNDFFNNDTK